MVVNSLMSRKRPEGLYHTAQDYFHKVGNVLDLRVCVQTKLLSLDRTRAGRNASTNTIWPTGFLGHSCTCAIFASFSAQLSALDVRRVNRARQSERMAQR